MKKIVTIILLLISSNAISSNKIQIVTTIKPIYSILKNITGNVANLDFVSAAQSSAHDYNIKPSDISKLNKADMIVIIDRRFDIELWSIIEKMHLEDKTLELSHAPELTLYKTRNNQIFRLDEEQHEHGDEEESHDHSEHHHHHAEFDYHIWLDIENVKKISAYFITNLAVRDNQHLKDYEANMSVFYEELSELDFEINDLLSEEQDKGFVVMHDGYQYFEVRYHLNNYGSIIGNSHSGVGLKTLVLLQDFMNKNHINCVLSEPYFNTQFLINLKTKHRFKISEIDGEWGGKNVPNKEFYFDMMLKNANSIKECLKN
jgi:zinc transport system substrate-binding protein